MAAGAFWVVRPSCEREGYQRGLIGVTVLDMSYPQAGTVGVVQPIINCTVASAAAALAALPANPSYNTQLAVGVNSGPSTSLANPTNGVNGNTSADPSVWIPAVMVQLQSLVLTEAGLVYRL